MRRAPASRAATDAALLSAAWLATPATFAEHLTSGRWLAGRWHRYVAGLLADAAWRAQAGGRARIALCAPTRHGKALALGTRVATPSGWSVIEALCPGDEVFGPDGAPCRVRAVSPIFQNRPAFRVTADDGASVVADADHEWMVRLEAKRKAVSCRTTSYLAARTSPRRAMIQRPGALALPWANLTIDPYVLGVWLGDGCSHHATISKGDEDLAFLRQQIEQAGYVTSDRASAMSCGILGLKAQLRAAGLLMSKRIPAEYLRAHADQRLALLQGLVDTDGYVSEDGQVEVCSVDGSLARQIQELVRSLGRKAAVYEGEARIGQRSYGKKYRVTFYMANAARLPRRADRCRDADKTPHRYITVEPCGYADTVCIQVDSLTGEFLCGDGFLVTHNSELVSHWLPAWTLALFGQWPVLLASYEADFAASWGRKVRDTVNAHAAALALKVRDDLAAASRWETSRGGAMMTAGIGGAFTGKGGRLLIVDDPIKNREQANSPTYLRLCWDWWREVASPRLDPGNMAVVAMARWSPDDLVGKLIAEEGIGGTAWQVIVLPELAEPGDLLGRQPGEVLWPERFTAQETAERCREAGGPASRAWLSLHQQRPQAQEGAIFRGPVLQAASRPDLALEAARWACRRCAVEGPAEAHCERCERRLTPREYVTAWDLARKRDWVVGITVDATDDAAQIVAFERFQHAPWPEVARRIEARAEAYPGRTLIDSTGVGDPVMQFLNVGVEGVLFSAKSKADMVTALMLALEAGEIVGPATGDGIEALWSELAAYRWDDADLIQDAVMALAMLAHALRTVRVVGGVA